MTPANHLPTPEEIAEACRAIQETWDDYERDFRYRLAHSIDGDCIEPAAYTFPTVRFEAA